jgi:hypothetical protein
MSATAIPIEDVVNFWAWRAMTGAWGFELISRYRLSIIWAVRARRRPLNPIARAPLYCAGRNKIGVFEDCKPYLQGKIQVPEWHRVLILDVRELFDHMLDESGDLRVFVLRPWVFIKLRVIPTVLKS